MSDNPEDYELFHYGVLGMKWGRRKTRNGTYTTTEKALAKEKKAKSKAKAKTAKPSSSAPSEDASRAKDYYQKAKKHGVESLSNKELTALNTRLNLERQYSSIKPKELSRGQMIAKNTMLILDGAQRAYNIYNSPVIKEVRKNLQNESYKKK